MAKKHKNLENLPIQWDGDIVKPSDGSAQSTPDNTNIVWGSNPYTWGDVNFVIEIADGLGTGNRRAREARLHQLDDEKKKKLIHLICRIKGEKVYDDYTESGNIEVKVEDVELVAENIMGKKLKLEIKSGV